MITSRPLLVRILWKVVSRVMPALLTRMSTGPQLFLDLATIAARRPGVGDVARRHARRRCRRSRIVCCHVARLVLVAIIGGDRVAEAGQPPADRRADAAGSACHQCDALRHVESLRGRGRGRRGRNVTCRVHSKDPRLRDRCIGRQRAAAPRGMRRRIEFAQRCRHQGLAPTPSDRVRRGLAQCLPASAQRGQWIGRRPPAAHASDLDSLRPSASSTSGRCAIARRGQAERALQQDLARRGIEQVGAAHDVGDALRGIVDHHGQLVGPETVGAREHEIADRRARRPARCGPGSRRRTSTGDVAARGSGSKGRGVVVRATQCRWIAGVGGQHAVGEQWHAKAAPLAISRSSAAWYRAPRSLCRTTGASLPGRMPPASRAAARRRPRPRAAGRCPRSCISHCTPGVPRHQPAAHRPRPANRSAGGRWARAQTARGTAAIGASSDGLSAVRAERLLKWPATRHTRIMTRKSTKSGKPLRC